MQVLTKLVEEEPQIQRELGKKEGAWLLNHRWWPEHEAGLDAHHGDAGLPPRDVVVYVWFLLPFPTLFSSPLGYHAQLRSPARLESEVTVFFTFRNYYFVLS